MPRPKKGINITETLFPKLAHGILISCFFKKNKRRPDVAQAETAEESAIAPCFKKIIRERLSKILKPNDTNCTLNGVLVS